MTRNSSFAALLGLGLVVLSPIAACTLLTKTNRDLIPDGGGGSGASDEGGGGAGAQGAGTTTSPPCDKECCSPSDCPSPENECLIRTCVDGACGTEPVENNTPVSTQAPDDCLLFVCDGNGGTIALPANEETPDDGNACTTDKCQGGAPKNTNAPAGTSCNEDGGKKCDGSGVCVECIAPADCVSKVCLVTGACAPPACADGVKNGDETDTDCGGVCGATCATGKKCTGNADCLSHLCNAMTLTCSAPACDDEVKNGDETDVDCGGACGPTCLVGQACSEDADCVGDSCSGSFCLPSCTDGVKNNAETGTDCGGPLCDATCAEGIACMVPSDCASAFCVDSVCCDSPCDAECAACSNATKGGGSDGVCGVAAEGTDPHDDCAIAAPDTCGHATGLCAAFGACALYPTGTLCGDSPSCTSGVATLQDACDGNGTCADSGTSGCGLYACGASACLSSCADHPDCADTAYCDAGACVPKKTNGIVCGADVECATGACVDGVCCNNACQGLCAACSVAAGATVDGTCGPVAVGTDPASECAGAEVCGGVGICKKPDGATCTTTAECLSGSCADGYCCNAPCLGLCQACSATKKGIGSNGSCGFITLLSDPDNECPGVTTCSGSGTCALLNLGESCTTGAECQSGTCTEGVCCTGTCLGICRSCLAVKTGGTNGVCGGIAAGTDPDNECDNASAEPNCAAEFLCGP